MREIKFRGHQTASDTWFYGNYVSYLPKKDPFDPIPPCLICDIVDDNGTKHFVNPFTVGQFTGLHDKNGVDIYEGDIVHLDAWSPYYMQICFIEGAFCLADKNGRFLGDIHYIHHAEVEQCIVVGNIHNNPELLKEEK